MALSASHTPNIIHRHCRFLGHLTEEVKMALKLADTQKVRELNELGFEFQHFLILLVEHE